MKRLRSIWLIGICLCISAMKANAQVSTSSVSDIKSWKLTVGFYKTTNLIFPYAIKSVDRGSSAVLVQKAKGVDNILQVKAGKKDFESTNLSLVTTDGVFYSFVLEYGAEPSPLNLRFDKSNEKGFAELFGQSSIRNMEEEAGIVSVLPSFLNIRRNRERMRLTLNGIFLSDSRMWFRLKLDNRSQIDFRPDYVHFFLRDKKKAKRTAIQETELFPVYTSVDEIIAGGESDDLALAFKPFTVPHNKQLTIQVGELNGGRFIDFSLNNRTILKARQVK